MYRSNVIGKVKAVLENLYSIVSDRGSEGRAAAVWFDVGGLYGAPTHHRSYIGEDTMCKVDGE